MVNMKRSLYVLTTTAVTLSTLPLTGNAFCSPPRTCVGVQSNPLMATADTPDQELTDYQELTDSTSVSEFMSTKHNLNMVSSTTTSSTLNMMDDERREFELNLGKALDTLRHDYPGLLKEAPDFEIYAEDLLVVDPSGWELHGIKNYKTFFRLLRSIVGFIYCPSTSVLTYRLVYCFARKQIRVTWNAVLVPKAIYGGTRNTLYVDGISVYGMGEISGKVKKHTIEKLVINDTPVDTRNGIWHAVTDYNVDSIPVLGLGGASGGVYDMNVNTNEKEDEPFTTFAMSSGTSADSEPDSFERKNASRAKFGLKAISREEYDRIQVEVKKMEIQTRKAQAGLELAREMSQTQKKKSNFLTKMLGGILDDTCESNYDCERPQLCCDFVFKKMCCASGAYVGQATPQMQRMPIPVPVNDDFPRMPPGPPGRL